MSLENPPKRSSPKAAEAPVIEKTPTTSAEKQSDKPITMLNPALNRAIGMPERKRKRSLSEGGNSYVPMVLESAFGEKAAGPVVPEAPIRSEKSAETLKEEKMQFRKVVSETSMHAIDFRIAYLSEQIRQTEMKGEEDEKKHGLRFGPNWRSKNSELTTQERVQKYEAERKILLEDKKYLMAAQAQMQTETTLRATASAEMPVAAPAIKSVERGDMRGYSRFNAAFGSTDQKITQRIDSLPPTKKATVEKMFAPIPMGDPKRSKSISRFRAALLGITAAAIGIAGTSAVESVQAKPATRIEQVQQFPKFPPLTSTVKEGEGAYALIAHLQAQADHLPAAAKASPLVRTILGSTPEKLAPIVGFLSKDGTADHVIHPGGVLRLTDNGELRFLTAHDLATKGAGHLLLKENMRGDVSPTPLEAKHHVYHPEAHRAHSAAHKAHESPAVASQEEESLAALQAEGAKVPYDEASRVLNRKEAKGYSQAHPVHTAEAPVPEQVSPTPPHQSVQSERPAPPSTKPIVEAPAAGAPKVESPTVASEPELVIPAPEASLHPFDVPQVYPRGAFTNKHHLEITPNKAEIFADKEGRLIAYGGTFEERNQVAYEYVATHPLTIVMFDSTSRDPDTGEIFPSVSARRSDGMKVVTPIPESLKDLQGRPLNISDPDDFVKKLS